MIKGIGIDIIELDRIQKSIKNKRFIDRILTEREKALYLSFENNNRRVEFVAGRFAAKEAVSKALGTGIGKLSFQHIEVLPNELGAPTVQVRGLEKDRIFLSITHSKTYAVAQVVMEQE
jgi:holo-[acyl-carrier protein] synthase